MTWRDVAMDIVSGVLLIIASAIVVVVVAAIPVGIGVLLLLWAGIL